MRLKSILFFILVFFLLTNAAETRAQTTKKNSATGAKTSHAKTDSIAKARQHAIDSTKKARETATKNTAKARANKADSTAKARKHAIDSTKKAREKNAKNTAKLRASKADSIKAVREAKTDSIAKARKRVTDSAARVRKHKESKKYRDSVTKSKTLKTKAVQDKRKARTDSIAEARTRSSDSLAMTRKTRSDSIKAKQKTRTDSLAKVKKYKASKRYADSVTLARRHRSDSIKAEQKEFRDSIGKVRKRSLDSAKKSRARILDSTKVARTKKTDSLAKVRKAKTDSLAKKKDAKAKQAKTNEKKKQEAIKLKLELKIKQQRKEWSNTSMLKKKWGPVRRTTQNSFTHYNYYYNANRKLEEAEANMQRANKENYDSLIGLFPFDPNKDSAMLAADMDSIIRKVSVGLQIHDPRVKWSNDMYLMLGEAYYYKGNYENAATAFRYIIVNDQKAKNKKGKGKKGSYAAKKKEGPSIVEKKKKSKLGFLQHKSVHNEAILWLARTYTTAGQVDNAESVLSLLEYDDNFPENLKGRLAVEKAFAYLKVRNYPDASKQLSIAAEDDNLPELLRVRIAFLNGQLLQNTGDYAAAAESFEEVLNHFPKIEMDFYTRKYIAYNKLMAGQQTDDATVALKKILKDGKYSGFYDQVYYILGKMAAKENKNEDAIMYLKKSTATPKASKKQKAMSFAAMGDVYYSTARYSAAKTAYDSAAKYSSGSKDKAVVAAVQRSSGLSEISGPANVIKEQDSLLGVAKLSKKEQQSLVRRNLRDLEKQKADSAFKAESAGGTPDVEAEMDRGEGMSTGWYFSNAAQMSIGNADFKRKWGSRPLVDNWRRASSAPLVSGSKSGGSDEDEDEPEAALKLSENGLPTEDALLGRIPNTPQQKENAIKIQQKAYILLAKAYVTQLDDYKQAIHTLDTLNTRYPNHGQKEEELYLRYQIAIKQNKLDKAQEYSKELLTKYPNSQYANLLKPRQGESTMNDEKALEVATYFDETYKQLMGHQYTEALMRTDIAKKKYNHPVYKKRFEVVEAMAYAGSGNFDMADSSITKFIKANPSDSLTPWAKSVKKYIAEVRNGGKPSWYTDKPYTYTPPAGKKSGTKDGTKDGAPKPPPMPEIPEVPDAPATYSYNADAEHYFIAVLPGLDSRTGLLKQAIKDYDSVKYSSMGLSVLIDLYSMSQSVVVIGKFANAAQAKTYMADLTGAKAFANYKTEELNLYIISANNYKKMFVDKSPNAYQSFYNTNYSK